MLKKEIGFSFIVLVKVFHFLYHKNKKNLFVEENINQNDEKISDDVTRIDIGMLSVVF
jgi:hypothetical protein